VGGDTESIRERLEVIAEELADLAIEALRAALAAGEEKRPAAEKRLTQARRAVEKAAGLLKDHEPHGF
jgi:hypothetical protein